MRVCAFGRGADIRLVHRDADGTPYASLVTVRRAHPEAVFAMNAGMYHADLGAVGLYVEDGVEAVPLRRGASPGNFGLLPNGVFWVDDHGAHVAETEAFAESRATPRHATQSGPMLLVGGELHPHFIEGSTSRKIRNGVGIADGEVLFVKSVSPTNFHTFARYFQARGASEALYLDGTISQMWSPETGVRGWRYPVGPVVVVYPDPDTAP